MATIYTDQFFFIDPNAGLPPGTNLSVNFLDIKDKKDDGDIDVKKDKIDGMKIKKAWDGDTITVQMNGATVTITGTTFELKGGERVFTPTDGTVLSNATFVSSSGSGSKIKAVAVKDLGPPCFTAGTMILTDTGERLIEELQVGDVVKTVDHGLQPIRWIGCSPTDASGDHAPVLFQVGAIGNELELRVSPQHRVLLQGWQAELYFGQSEILIPAKHLLNGETIYQETSPSVTYFHILFDQHEVVSSNGVLSESFFPGDQILLQNRQIQAELIELFPDLENCDNTQFAKTARPTLKQREAKILSFVA